MSIGNLKDQGNKGNNFPYQLKTLQLLGAINASISALPGAATETTLLDIKSNSISKIDRIKGSADYTRVFVYYIGTSNVETITHTGTTDFAGETIIETFTYVNNLVDGSDVTSIIYS